MHMPLRMIFPYRKIQRDSTLERSMIGLKGQCLLHARQDNLMRSIGAHLCRASEYGSFCDEKFLLTTVAGDEPSQDLN